MKGRYSCLPFRAASAGLVLMGCKQPLPIVPPTLTITSHKNGPVVTGTTTLSGEPADEAGLSSVQASFDGGTSYGTATGIATCSIELDTTTVDDGNVHTQAVASDSDGSTGKAAITVAAGNVPEPTYTSGPVLTIVNPGAEQFATLMN